MPNASADVTDRYAWLKHAASNIALALLFFAALLPRGSSRYQSSVADDIWLVGAVLMGMFSLVRLPPKAAIVSAKSIAATFGMMILPTFVTAQAHSTGVLFDAAIMLEIIGVGFSQTARVYLGRSFGLLPANRKVVTGGPFRLMRHPIYLGWLVLSIGYVMVHLTVRNGLTILLVLPFMISRITQEERLLRKDPEYEAYCQKVLYRLIPGIF